MSASFRVTRRIEIDAGHRIMTHGSKCRHLHGHRYGIEAVCEAASLHDEGEQSGMVVDFGFLKAAMMEIIDTPCDHGFIAASADSELLSMFAPQEARPDVWIEALRADLTLHGAVSTCRTRLGTKLYVIPFQPTAECLARHWYDLLSPVVLERSSGLGRLVSVRVFETPNCMAEYSPGA